LHVHVRIASSAIPLHPQSALSKAHIHFKHRLPELQLDCDDCFVDRSHCAASCDLSALDEQYVANSVRIASTRPSNVLVSSSGVVVLTFSFREKFQNLWKRLEQRAFIVCRTFLGAWRSCLWVCSTSRLTNVSIFSAVGTLWFWMLASTWEATPFKYFANGSGDHSLLVFFRGASRPYGSRFNFRPNCRAGLKAAKLIRSVLPDPDTSGLPDASVVSWHVTSWISWISASAMHMSSTCAAGIALSPGPPSSPARRASGRMGSGMSSPFDPDGEGDGTLPSVVTTSSRGVSPWDITEEFVAVSDQPPAPEEHREEISPSRPLLSREEDLEDFPDERCEEPPREPRDEPPLEEAPRDEPPPLILPLAGRPSLPRLQPSGRGRGGEFVTSCGQLLKGGEVLTEPSGFCTSFLASLHVFPPGRFSADVPLTGALGPRVSGATVCVTVCVAIVKKGVASLD